MPSRRRAPSPPALSPDLKRLLLDGPHAMGLTYQTSPPHAELRRLWAIHGEALLRENPKAWFVDRDYFVRQLGR